MTDEQALALLAVLEALETSKADNPGVRVVGSSRSLVRHSLDEFKALIPRSLPRMSGLPEFEQMVAEFTREWGPCQADSLNPGADYYPPEVKREIRQQHRDLRAFSEDLRRLIRIAASPDVVAGRRGDVR